ncbi:MAG: hypothetical protein NXI24_15100 [bacterium]|nr:hypothetical protein [bacterium]
MRAAIFNFDRFSGDLVVGRSGLAGGRWSLRLFASVFAIIVACVPLLLIGCDGGQDSAGEAAARGGEIELEQRSYDAMPELKLGKIFVGEESGGDSGKPTAAQSAEAQRVLDLMRKLMGMLEDQEIRGLAQHVSPGKGLYVDLKAHRTRAAVQKDLQDPEGYLQTYYLNTENLRLRTEDPDQLAVRDILHLTRVMTADVYLQADGRQCELRLRLEDAPSKSYYLNNPVFVKEDGEWFIYRLF